MFQDARDFQICFLSLFLGLGLWLKDWTLRPEVVLSAVLTCIVTQAIVQGIISLGIIGLRQISNESLDSPCFDGVGALRSALITGISLSLLLRTDHWYTMTFAASVAILSKFLIRVKHKHLFNPANAGIIAALVLSQDAWVSPGQWGELGWYAIAFMGGGGIVLGRVGRWDTSVTFLATYGALMVTRDIWLGWSWDVTAHHLSGSLLLFALFMMTDPRTTPDARLSRILWAVCVGSLTFVLQTVLTIPIAVFWSLFCLTPLTPLLDSLWASQRFQWSHKPTTAC